MCSNSRYISSEQSIHAYGIYMWYLHTAVSTVTRSTELRTLAIQQRNSRTCICDILHVVQLMLCIPTQRSNHDALVYIPREGTARECSNPSVRPSQVGGNVPRTWRTAFRQHLLVHPFLMIFFLGNHVATRRLLHNPGAEPRDCVSKCRAEIGKTKLELRWKHCHRR